MVRPYVQVLREEGMDNSTEGRRKSGAQSAGAPRASLGGFMGATTDQRVTAVETIYVQLEAEARKNGRMEFALDLANWAHKRRAELPPHLRTELANMILKAGQ